MRRVLATLLGLACGLSSCATRTPQPEAEVASPPELTAERAREAMIALIRSAEPGDLKEFPLERFEGDGVARGDSDFPSWGPFFFHLKEQEYTYGRSFGKPPRVRRWQYRGRFAFEQGQWIAQPPRVESQALGAE